MGVRSEASISFISTRVSERERGDIRRRERICAAIAGRTRGGLVIYKHFCLYR